jgi:hypothetical protein
MLTILVLDDDPVYLAAVGPIIIAHGARPILCNSVDEAEKALSEPIDCALVDQYLNGDDGAELSDNFIADFLEPRGIKFARVTSAPGSVKQRFRGNGIIDKRLLWGENDEFLEQLYLAFPSLMSSD